MIRNIRDLSIIAHQAGVPLRSGCLIRSANLHQAAQEELIRISAVIDLRSDMEKEQMPDQTVDWISYYHIPFFNESAAGITREKSLSAVPDMKQLYRDMLEKESLRSHLQDVLRKISMHDFSTGAILWHCTAGKDRCGIVSAIVLQTLGVSREYIMQDYLLSNRACAQEGEEVYRKLLLSGQPEETAAAVREVFLAKPEYLQAALDAYDRNPLEFPDAEKFRIALL